MDAAIMAAATTDAAFMDAPDMGSGTVLAASQIAAVSVEAPVGVSAVEVAVSVAAVGAAFMAAVDPAAAVAAGFMAAVGVPTAADTTN
jgi:hypothetical protein